MTTRTTRRLRLGVVALTSTAMISACGIGGDDSGGGDYPSKDVKIVVPFGAGGPASLAAQASGDCMSEGLGQEFVVENKPGGTGAVGMTQVMNSGNDGHTLGVGSIGNMVLGPLLNDDVDYTHEDFTPIGTIYQMPSIIAVSDSSTHTDLEGLFAAAKKESKSLSMATPGNTTMQNTEMKDLAEEYGVSFKLVPYDGTAEALTAVLGGNADAMFLEASQPVLENIEAGKLTVLASGTPEPVDFLDDVPTLKELGYPEMVNSTVFFGLVAPADAPDEVVTTLSGALEECMSDDDVRDKLDARFVPDPFVGPDDMTADITSAVEVAKNARDE